MCSARRLLLLHPRWSPTVVIAVGLTSVVPPAHAKPLPAPSAPTRSKFHPARRPKTRQRAQSAAPSRTRRCGSTRWVSWSAASSPVSFTCPKPQPAREGPPILGSSTTALPRTEERLRSRRAERDHYLDSARAHRARRAARFGGRHDRQLPGALDPAASAESGSLSRRWRHSSSFTSIE